MVLFGFNPRFPRWRELKAGKMPVSGGAAMARWSAADPRGPGLCELGLGLDRGDWLCNGVMLLRALAMVDGVATIGDGLELWSSLSWQNLARSLQDSTLCRSHRVGFSGTKSLPDGSLVIRGIGDFFISNFGIGAGSCEGSKHWRSQVQFLCLIVHYEISHLLVISYFKLDLQLDKDRINVQLIMEVGCVMAATCDVATVCVGRAACCPSFCKWLHLISSGSGNINCFFLLEFKWYGCSCFTSTSTSSGLYHLFDLGGYMRNYLCCLVTMVVDTTLGDEICSSYYGVSKASLLNNQKAALVIGEVNLFGCLCFIWIKNEFEDILEESVKAFSFGSFHQWRVRSLLLLVPRFNGRHDPRLSSVKRTKNLQLSTIQPQVQKPIRSLGEPPGYYRRAHWLRPWRTTDVVARRSSRPIRHQAPLVVFTHSRLELLLELRICMMRCHVLATPFVGVPHPVNVL